MIPRRRISPWIAGLTGAVCGALSAWLFDLGAEGFSVYFAPGLFFGLGMALLLGLALRPLSARHWLVLAAFVCLSATAYRLAVEVAMRIEDWTNPDTLFVAGFAAGAIGAAKLTAVLQLTRLGRRGWLQFIVAPAIGGVFGLLLDPWMRLLENVAFGSFFLYVPWQTAVAIALLSFGLPEPKPGR